MSRFRGPRGLTIGLLFALVGATGCSQPAGLSSADSAASADQHAVPFHGGDSSTTASPSGAPATRDNKPKPDTYIPFRDPQSLPAGTLLTVRLKDDVSAENPDATGTFEAIVDEPVNIETNTVVPRGAAVAGRVESARAYSPSTSKVKHSGYVRLTLDSIDIAGKNTHLQTSSLFARGNPASRDTGLGLITLEKGRRLTFRLTEPIYLALEQTSPSH